MTAVHLARRFFASVVARPPNAGEEAWVRRVLLAGEFDLWKRQSRYDRRHSLGVARRAERALGEATEGRWLAAALLHDVGKTEACLGIMGRVIATLTMGAIGRPRVRAWATRDGWRGRFGRYGDHGLIGAELVRAAGGREEAATWASVHHLIKAKHPRTELGLPPAVVFVLRDSDRD